MSTLKRIATLIVLSVSIFSCSDHSTQYDASGTFEAVETLVSAEVSGKLMLFSVKEGDPLKAGQETGYIDSTQLYLQKLQLEQSMKAILAGRPAINTQLEALKKELGNAISDRDRIANLVAGDVASQKQLDDAETRIAVLRSRIAAQESSLKTTTLNLNEQAETIAIQLRQVEDQLDKCKMINPVNGTVLVSYANPFEMVAAGRPLYKIADLSELTLRAYITGNQLPDVMINQEVDVLTDDGQGGFRAGKGVVTWISDKAEFTPKTIQTKDERANLVYAIKVRVRNEGQYKIGMYGEVKF